MLGCCGFERRQVDRDAVAWKDSRLIDPLIYIIPLGQSESVNSYSYLRKTHRQFFFLFLLPFLHNHFILSSSTRRRVFTLGGLLDKPWSKVSSLLPSGTCLHFYRA